ncbi:nucleotide sugar dehydrogenase [Gammaproteobacteria bacterium]|nr:nucleotide sugar dehydrogenase [Gammaproteobacteria bacterium]
MKNHKIAVIGLGYVGLPLAVEFSKKYQTIGFDINNERIDSLNSFNDKTLEVTSQSLKNSINKFDLHLSSNKDDIEECNIFIVTVPTPIDSNNKPDLIPLISASNLVGSVLKSDDIVIYESTVYPGATEEQCAPILEKISGLKFNKDFYCGYSPERINPGDKQHTLTKIVKVTSGSTIKTAEIVDDLYSKIIDAGTHKAESIKVAEAAKVIENTQRDLNIALMNELSIIFSKMDIDTASVLEASGTKWNFLPFKPGLVGGHCIGVDPYYLTFKSQELGYNPQVILSGRNLNDGMGQYVAKKMIDSLPNNTNVKNVLILGLTFKENCPDIRNSKIVDLISSFPSSDFNLDIYDPWVDEVEAKKHYNIELIQELKNDYYDGIILAVGHEVFLKLGLDNIKKLGKFDSLFYDLKSIFQPGDSDFRL